MIPVCSGLDVFTYAAKIKRPLILDGAMGSLLRKKHAPHKSLWMSHLNVDAPEDVFTLHRQYLKAGADIITTNTFRTNPAVYNTYKGINNSDFVKKSVQIALEAVKGEKALVAGSNPPGEDCYQVKRTLSSKTLTANHHKHIDLLIDSGADLILNETLSHLDEILIICKYCYKNMLPFIISLYFNDNLRLLSGEKVVEVIKIIKDFSPLAISFNCMKPGALKEINLNALKFNWGAYLNCGLGAQLDDIIKSCLTPDEYLGAIISLLPYSPSFVGACCGSTPKHIKRIKEYLDEKH